MVTIRHFYFGLTFTGKELDDSTGLYYYGARYYDPVVCRFITPDGVMPFVVNLASGKILNLKNTYERIYDPQSLNRHVYCRNNPIKYVDPTGEDIELLIGGPYETHSYGHVALRVVGDGYDFTYDYGRYGKTWSIGGSEGEGMLRIWSNFKKYISKQNDLGIKTEGYYFNTTLKQDKTVMRFYQNLIKNKKANSEISGMKQFRIQDYNALKLNCTTLSEFGFSKAFPEVGFSNSEFNVGIGMSWHEKIAAKVKGWSDNIFMPLDLKAFFDNFESNYDISYEKNTYHKDDKKEE